MPDPASIFFIIIFSAVGLAAFRQGRRNNNVVCILLGVALMIFPYFIEGLAATLAVGLGLSAALWFSWN